MIKEQQARDAAARLYKREFVDVCEELTQWNIDAMTCVMWINEELARREWQDEPEGDGWYWLEHSTSKPFKVAKRDYCGSDDETYSPGWKYESKDMWWSLDCRVCKIIDRPESRRRNRRRVKR